MQKYSKDEVMDAADILGSTVFRWLFSFLVVSTIPDQPARRRAADEGSEKIPQSEVCKLLGISSTQFRTWVNAGYFPEAVEGNGRGQLWYRSEVMDWIEDPDRETFAQFRSSCHNAAWQA